MDSDPRLLSKFLNLVTAEGHDALAVDLISELTETSPVTVHRWRTEKHYPNGPVLMSLVCLSELLGKPFCKEDPKPLAKTLRDFVGFHVETLEGIGSLVGIRSASLSRFIRGGAGVSAAVAVDIQVFHELHQQALDEAKASWKDRFSKTLFGTIDASIIEKPVEQNDGPKPRRESDSTTLTALGHQIRALAAMLPTFLAESTPETRKTLRRGVGHETISALRGHLQQLNLSDEPYANQPQKQK